MWPDDTARAVTLKQDSQFARDTIDPPEPQHVSERDAGMRAARAVLDDLRSTAEISSLVSSLSTASFDVDVPGSKVWVFNRAVHAIGWPLSLGGWGDFEHREGATLFHDAMAPDDAASGMFGAIESTVLTIQRFSLHVRSWNWLLPDSRGGVRETNPKLLPHDSTITMRFTSGPKTEGSPITTVRVVQDGLPARWLPHMEALLRWDIAHGTRRD